MRCSGVSAAASRPCRAGCRRASRAHWRWSWPGATTCGALMAWQLPPRRPCRCAPPRPRKTWRTCGACCLKTWRAQHWRHRSTRSRCACSNPPRCRTEVPVCCRPGMAWAVAVTTRVEHPARPCTSCLSACRPAWGPTMWWPPCCRPTTGPNACSSGALRPRCWAMAVRPPASRPPTQKPPMPPCGPPGCCAHPGGWRCRATAPATTACCACWRGRTGSRRAGGRPRTRALATRAMPALAWRCATILWRTTMWRGWCGCFVSGWHRSQAVRCKRTQRKRAR